MPNDPSIQTTAETVTLVGGDPTAVSTGGGQVVFEVIVAAMWSVGELIAAEVERSRAAVAAMGLQPRRGGSAFGTIAAGALPFAEIEFERLTRTEGRLAYAAARWLAAASVPSERRDQFLRALELRLRLSPGEAAELTSLARDVDLDAESPREAFAALISRV